MPSCGHGYRGVEHFTALMNMRRKVPHTEKVTYQSGGF